MTTDESPRAPNDHSFSIPFVLNLLTLYWPPHTTKSNFVFHSLRRRFERSPPLPNKYTRGRTSGRAARRCFRGSSRPPLSTWSHCPVNWGECRERPNLHGFSTLSERLHENGGRFPRRNGTWPMLIM
ncbi:unnamed protein product [Ectocarpus sp. 12 AP-2014]